MSLYALFSEVYDYDSNIYILKNGHEALLIDAGSGRRIDRLKKALEELGISRVDQILLTHNDHDHSGGVEFFPETIVKVHPLDRDSRLSRTENVEEGDEIKFGEYILKIIHTPGHSPGSISIYEKEHRWLFSGDTPMEFMPWVVDRRMERQLAEDQLRQSVGKLSKLDIEVVYKGHGRPEYR